MNTASTPSTRGTEMNEKSVVLYELMVHKGYPEEFAGIISSEMNTEFTAERMISYIAAPGKRSLEDVADEMIAIKSFRDRLRDKHIAENAQAKINYIYRDFNEGNDGDD